MKDAGAYFYRVNQEVNGIKSYGTVYLANQMIRGNFTSTINGNAMNSSFIIHDGYAYAWSGSIPVGVKMAAADRTTIKATSNEPQFAWDARLIGDYSCQSWSAEEYLFVPPTNVQFTEIR